MKQYMMKKPKKFKDPKDEKRFLTLKEAMLEGIVNPKSVLYDIPSGKVRTLEEGVKEGLISSTTGEVKQKSGKSINVKDAAKLGLLAVVGAPVLAGIAVADAVKKVVKKSESKDKISKENEEKPIPKERLIEKPVPTNRSSEKELPVPIERTKTEKKYSNFKRGKIETSRVYSNRNKY